mgnify:CR=1 FL=1
MSKIEFYSLLIVELVQIIPNLQQHNLMKALVSDIEIQKLANLTPI